MEKLDEILQKYVVAAGSKTNKEQLLGGAYVVVNKDGVIYQGSAGHVNSSSDSPKFTADSPTWIASMTKIVAAISTMQIVEKRLIGLDDDVRPLIPHLAEAKILRGFVGDDIPFLEENTTPITLRQLVTHTSGFGYAISDPDLARWLKHTGQSKEDVVGTVEAWSTPVKFTPGQGWYYGTGLDWAGQVVEKLTGQTLSEHMAEHIFQPLGMNNTAFRGRLPPHIQENIVPTSYRSSDGSGELTTGPDPFPNAPKADSGGAGLCTSALDYAKILQALLASSAGSGGLLKKETVDEMFRPQLTEIQSRWLKFLTDTFRDGMCSDFKPGMPVDHGMSGVINLEDAPGKRKKGSMMWGGMCNGRWFVDPTSGIGACFFTNILPQPDLFVTQVWDELERVVYGQLLPGLSS